MAATEVLAEAELRAENAQLRERLASAERYTAQTLARATRLSQVIAVLGHDAELDSVVGRAAVEVAELFSADIALLMLGPDDALTVAGQWGVRPADLPAGTFALAGPPARLTTAEPVAVAPAEELPPPEWLARYGACHVAWARLLVGDEALGLLLLVRRAPEPFERSDSKELGAIGYRIALAIQNGLLHRRTRGQLERLHRIQQLTSRLTGLLELDEIGRCVAEVLVSEVGLPAATVLLERDGELVRIGAAEVDDAHLPDLAGWRRFPLETAGRPLGWVTAPAAPAAGTEEGELLAHLVGLGAIALEKALLYERSREQARLDSLTGLLGHRVFQESLAERTEAGEPFSVVLVDIDDFKQINDLCGHQTGDDALKLVADALRGGVREHDAVFRVGGEEFCAVLPGLGHQDAFRVAERLRRAVAATVSALPLTVSLGVASFPEHATARDDLVAQADAALYASKRAGKNRTTVAGEGGGADSKPVSDGHAPLALLHDRDPDTVVHSVHVARLAVEVGRALGLGDDRLADLRTAAKLHDVGKIGVPDAILNKPGPLDEEEFRVVKTHPTVGAELLRAWGLDGPAVFVGQHHERFDGAGYPAGLGGEEIALESRIIHAVDAFVAMTLDRPYRRALSEDDARAELKRHRGAQFDPGVVDALLAVL